MDEELENFVHFLTLLIKDVSPSINEGDTYNVLNQMMANFESDEGVPFKHYKRYGKQIRDTMGKKTNKDDLN